MLCSYNLMDRLRFCHICADCRGTTGNGAKETIFVPSLRLIAAYWYLSESSWYSSEVPIVTTYTNRTPPDLLVYRSAGSTIVCPQDYIYLHKLRPAAQGSGFQLAWTQVLIEITGLSTPSTAGIHSRKISLLRQSQMFQRQIRARARLKNKVYLLHKTTASRLGEVAVLHYT